MQGAEKRIGALDARLKTLAGDLQHEASLAEMERHVSPRSSDVHRALTRAWSLVADAEEAVSGVKAS